MKNLVPRLVLLSALSAFALPLTHAVDYNEEIRPILNKKCYKCHTGPRAKGKLRMDTVENFSKRIGGDDPVILPGNSGNSLLAIKAGLPASNGDAMPPPPARSRGAEPMTALELNLVKKWIDAGASFEKGGPEPAAPTVVAAGEGMKEELLDWTNSAGNSLKAYFVAMDGANVKLRKEDGSEFSYPLANLNADSQALAKKLGAE
ncbi:MAG: hypothetical protein P1U87_15730 [Verrucomicrobiales bacterium]|nr:hypothetical protein [Verrucomicrobiales bacterium]